MKHFKRQHIAILPLLSILAMSPAMVEKNFHVGRSVASVVEEVAKSHPRYEAAIEKVKSDDTKNIEISKEQLQEKLGEVKLKLSKEREEFKKESSDEAIVSEQRKSVESLVAEVLLVDSSLKQLEEKKLIEEEELKANKQVVLESKDIVESLLADLEANEVLVVKAKEPKPEEEKPVVVAEEPKKEEPKVEEPKKEEEKEVVAKDTEKDKENKKEEPKETAKKEEVCEAEEKNKVLTAQVEELMKQNNQILQAMLNMSQMMFSLFQQQQQQQQQNPFYANGPGWNQSPYQYNQPQSAGNWVYYPNGFQPQQQNIFAQPQQMGPNYSMYPNQIHMQQPMQQPMQSQWMLNADPRYTIQNSFTPGTFGSDTGSLTFNMGQAPGIQQPMTLQAPAMNPMPVLTQAPMMNPGMAGQPQMGANIPVNIQNAF